MRRTCLGIIACLLLTLPPVWAQELCAKPWIVGVTDRLPLQGFNPQHQPVGLEVTLLKMAADKLHCQVQFQDIPWKRQFLFAEQGQVSIVMGAGKRKDREGYLYYLRPYLHEPTVLVTAKTEQPPPAIGSMHDIMKQADSFLVGAQVGSSYSQEFDDLAQNPAFTRHLVLVVSNEKVMRLFLAHRVQAALFGDPFEPYKMLQSIGQTANISMQSLDPSGTDFAYFTYSKKVFDEKSARQIDDTILAIIDSPTFSTLLHQYFQEDEIRILTSRFGFKAKDSHG